MEKKSLILAVDYNRRNLELLRKFIENEGCLFYGASSLEEFDQVLDEERTINLALVDLSGFDHGILQRFERLHKANTPFLVISPRKSVKIEQSSLSHGAKGVLVKPLVMKELQVIIHAMLED